MKNASVAATSHSPEKSDPGATPEQVTGSRPKSRTSTGRNTKSHTNGFMGRQYLTGAIAEANDWIKMYENQPGRGSLIKVLKDAIQRMERAETDLRAARMIETGSWPNR